MEHRKPAFSGALRQGSRGDKNVEAKSDGSLMPRIWGLWKTSPIFKAQACGSWCFTENQHLWTTWAFQKTLCWLFF